MALETQRATKSSTTTHRMQTRSVTRSQRHGAVKDLIKHTNERFNHFIKHAVASNMWDFLGNGSTPSNLALSKNSSEATVAAVSRNLNHPLNNVDGFTATAYWNDRQAQARHGTLITPRHIYACDHYVPTVPAGTYPNGSFVAGDKLAFKDNKNNTYFRTVIGVSDEILGGTIDAEVATLNEDLPDSIQPMKILPPDVTSYIEVELNVRTFSAYNNLEAWTSTGGDGTPKGLIVQYDGMIPQPIMNLGRNRYGKWGTQAIVNVKAQNLGHLPSVVLAKADALVNHDSSSIQDNPSFLYQKFKNIFTSTINGLTRHLSTSSGATSGPQYIPYRDVNEYNHYPTLDLNIPSGSSGGPRIGIINNECVLFGRVDGGNMSSELWGTQVSPHSKTALGGGGQVQADIDSQTILTAIAAADAAGGVSTGYKPESINLSGQFSKPKNNVGIQSGNAVADNWPNNATPPVFAGGLPSISGEPDITFS